MASQSNNRDNNPQRKILEELQLKKQLILKQGASQPLNTPATSAQPTGWSSGTDGHIAGNSQRSSLVQATSSSFGYFIHQDSSFGNFILPVLPRLEPK
ncbi:SOSS complex subunit C homolog isoform X2 [Palaemon carinicauda]|uniref:SOSS complex subunit C homolog isoform X2 n=1 Tax=Palaemon carinicauda TaxID=392227 RepID=UPI0035B681AA